MQGEPESLSLYNTVGESICKRFYLWMYADSEKRRIMSMKKSLNKSSNSNQLSTFFDLYASCGCGPCGCACGGADVYVLPNMNMAVIEAGYRNSVDVHTS